MSQASQLMSHRSEFANIVQIGIFSNLDKILSRQDWLASWMFSTLKSLTPTSRTENAKNKTSLQMSSHFGAKLSRIHIKPDSAFRQKVGKVGKFFFLSLSFPVWAASGTLISGPPHPCSETKDIILSTWGTKLTKIYEVICLLISISMFKVE